MERYEEAKVRQPIGDVGAAFLTRTTLKFVAPPELATLPVLSTQYRPLILDFDPAIGTWFEVPVGTERIGLPVNLLIQRMTVEYWSDKGLPVPLAEKHRLDSHPHVPTQYRKIQPRIGCG